MNRKLEIACFSLESAKVALAADADRIEFCEDYASGGVTPSLADFRVLRDISSKPIFVMIRPRAGHFVYEQVEVEQMQQCIAEFYQAGADGFVFGCLTADSKIDIKSNEMLVKAAKEKACTFHRAFDETTNWPQALEAIIECGFKNILTSGRRETAMEGLPILKELKVQAQDSINIIPGGGLRSTNIRDFARQFDVEFYHSAALVGDSLLGDADEINKMKELIKTI